MPLGPHSERTHDVLAALAARCRLQLHETVCEVDEPVIPAREAEDLTGAFVKVLYNDHVPKRRHYG